MCSHVPNEVMRTNNRIARVDMRCVPNACQAVRMYHAEGGRISDETYFGEVLILPSLQSEHERSVKGFPLFISSSNS